jgi:hypothetical protein
MYRSRESFVGIVMKNKKNGGKKTRLMLCQMMKEFKADKVEPVPRYVQFKVFTIGQSSV